MDLSFEKNLPFRLFFSVLLKRKFCYGRSFPFFWKEHFVPAVLFCSFEKNVPFRPFFSVLLKRTFCSSCSFLFFWKECAVLAILFRPIEKNGTFFLRNGKEQNVQNGKECAPIPGIGGLSATHTAGDGKNKTRQCTNCSNCFTTILLAKSKKYHSSKAIG